MDNTFKIRIFDKVENKFHYFDLSNIEDIENYAYFASEKITYSEIFNSLPKNKCIGLYDIENNLIYEEDIFQVNNDGCCIFGIVKYDEDKARFSIHEYGYDEEWNGLYDESVLGFFESYSFDEYHFDKGRFPFKIIGNSFQNPELVECL